MNKIIIDGAFVFLQLNNGTIKGFLGSTLRYVVDGSALSFFLLDNDFFEKPVCTVNIDNTTVNDEQLTIDNINDLLAPLYQAVDVSIKDFYLDNNDMLHIVTTNDDFIQDLSKFNYDDVISDLTKQLNDEILRSTNADTALQGKIDVINTEIDNLDNVIMDINNEIDVINSDINDIHTELDTINNSIDIIETNLTNEISRSIAKEAELQTQISNNLTKLDSEIIRSTNTDTALQGNIDIVSNNLANEIINRANGYDNLANVIQGAYDNINQEINNRIAADEDLQNQINTHNTVVDEALTTVNEKLNQEITDRNNSDSSILTIINKEISDRTAADVELQNNIDTEITNRINADSIISTNLTNEITRATTKENSLQTQVTNNLNKLDNEIIRAISIDSTLFERIDNEIIRATNAESTITNIINNLQSEIDDTYTIEDIDEKLEDKQDKLVSGTNLKTINNQSLLGSGNIDITSGGGISDAPSDGKLYGRQDGNWSEISGGEVCDWSDITNKPSFATVATSGSYNDLSNKPTIPTTTSQLTNNSGYITSSDVAGKADTTYVNTQLNLKADKTTTYTKTEVDDLIDDVIAGDLADYYKKSETYNQTEVNNLLNNKVDQINGKGLSTNDYSTADKNKLAATPLFIQMTQVQYDALTIKENNTIYIIIG